MPSVKDYGALCDDDTDDTSAIEQALLEVTSGPLILPGISRISRTLRIKNSDVQFIGFGSGHNANSNSISSVSALRWVGRSNQTMLEVMPDIGGTHLGGVQIRDIGFFGEEVAGKGLHVRSVIHGVFRVFVTECQQAGVYVDCWATSVGQYAITDWADVQDCIWDIEGRQVRPTSGPIFEIRGDEWTGDVTADFSGNHNIFVRGSYGGSADAHGVVVGNSDNNTFTVIDLFDNSAGVSGAYGLWITGSEGGDLSGAFARHNVFRRVGAGAGGVFIEGIDTTDEAAENNYIEWMDKQGNPLVIWGEGTHTNRVWNGESFADLNHWTAPATIALTGDASTTSTSFVDVADSAGEIFEWAVRPGWRYRIDFSGTYSSTADNNGLSIGFDAPVASSSNIRAMVELASAGAATIAYEFITAMDTATGTTTTDLANTKRFWRISGLYQCNAVGTLTMRFKRNGAGAGTITIHAGSGGTITPIRSSTATGAG